MVATGEPDLNQPSKPEPMARDQLAFFPKPPADHPTAWSFPESLDNPNCRWLQALKALYAEPITFPASLSPDAGLLLHAMIRNFRPRTIVEVGSFVSVSTHWMAAALLESGASADKARIHCFDDFGPILKSMWRDAEMLEGRLEWVRDRLTTAGLIDFVQFHPGNSSVEIASAREMLADQGGVDLAFIDGDHTVLGATSDFLAVEPVLNTGGYALFHDTFPEQCGGHDGPRHLTDHVNEIGAGVYQLCELYLAPLNYGMTLMRRIG